MPAANTDKFKKATAVFSTTLNGSISSGATTLTLNSTAGLPTDTAVVLTIDATDANGTATPGTKEVIIGTVSGSTITNLTRGVEGTQQLHSSGAVVVDYVTAKHWNDLLAALLTVHNQDGSMVASLPLTTPVLTSPTSTGGTLTTPAVVSPTLSGLNPGWVTGLTAPTVTASGNRNYSLSVASTDYTDRLSAGMRLMLTRTVAAPTQCTSLNGSTQYFSKTTPTGMTFTNNFVVSVWIKVASYTASTIVSRFNGTSGWKLDMDSSGRILLTGYNASGSNFSGVNSSQSVPLNRWIHVSAQLDMATFTATTATSYVMFDGLDVPAVVFRGGTNPTALIQAGDLNIGAYNAGTTPFPGKIAQVAIYNAKVTQANILLTISQTLAGTETSLISAYSFNNSINDLNANANNLTAQGSAVATNTDSPFGTQASGLISSTLEYAKIIAVTFSTNTTITVEVAAGNAIPSTGGITAMAYSSAEYPYGCPRITGARNCRVVSSSTTASTTPADLADAGGGAVTVNIGPSGQALVSWAAWQSNSGADATAVSAFAVTGATTITGTVIVNTMNGFAQTRESTANAQATGANSMLLSDLVPGSTTFTQKFYVGAGTGTFANRLLSVTPL